MNTYQLLDAMIHDVVAGKQGRFQGVYPRDCLVKLTNFKYPFGVIVNTSKASDDDGGTHWVGVWIEDASRGEFMCSFGKPALFYGIEIHNFILRATPLSNGIIRENLIQIQHYSSNMCGAFALYFIYNRVRGVSFARIVFSFTYPHKLERNDVLLRNFLRTKVHICRHPKACLDHDALATPKQGCLKMYKLIYR